ncbi:MAG: hypothetical protein V1644_02870 [Candidatus Micrarchaeota archaeon]
MKYRCYFGGNCKNKPYCEVYPGLLGGKHKERGWSYLCRKHFKEEQKKYRGNLPYCLVSRKKVKEMHVPKNIIKRLSAGKTIPFSEVMKKYAAKT